ncbi:rCG27175, partial [Rattus norvegicus]
MIFHKDQRLKRLYRRARPSCSLPLSLKYHSLCARLPRLW